MRLTFNLLQSRILISGFVIFSGQAALADDLKCNRSQTECLISSTQLTIGDEVGIFNRDGELVAIGAIKSMKGERRAVAINKRYGQINKGYELSRLERSPSSPEFKSIYKIYREPAKLTVGASLGLASIGIGESSPATEISGYSSWRSWRDVQVVGRATYLRMQGRISGYNEADDFGSAAISLNGFGVLGGAAYTLRQNQPISFRGELGLGLMYVKASIDDDPQLVKKKSYNAKVNNGFGLYSRVAVGAVYNLESWHFSIDFSDSLIHGANAVTIVTGVSKDLK